MDFLASSVSGMGYDVPMNNNTAPAVGDTIVTVKSGLQATVLRVIDKGTRYQLAVSYPDGTSGWTTYPKEEG